MIRLFVVNDDTASNIRHAKQELFPEKMTWLPRCILPVHAITLQWELPACVDSAKVAMVVACVLAPNRRNQQQDESNVTIVSQELEYTKHIALHPLNKRRNRRLVTHRICFHWSNSHSNTFIASYTYTLYRVLACTKGRAVYKQDSSRNTHT